MMSQLKQLGKDTLIYGFGEMIVKSIGFFLLPVYTRIFSPAEYGTIEMLIVLNGFIAAILVLGMDSAQSYYFFQQTRDGSDAQAKMISAILQWRICWGTIIVLTATLLSPLLNKFFFNGILSWEYFALAFAASFFSQIMIQSAEIFRLQYKSTNYIALIALQSILGAIVSLTVIVGFGFGISGIFWGTLSSAFVSAIYGWYCLREYMNFTKWHIEWWPRLLKFGAPLVPAGLMMYVLNSSDRWFIIHFHGSHILGHYAVGAKFSMLLTMAVITFRRAWWPIAMESIQRNEGQELFRTTARLYLGLGVIAVVLLSAFSPYLIRLMSTPNYFQAYQIIGILSWHAIFYGFYLFSAAGIWRAEKTVWIPLSAGAAALLNIVLNACLVPRYGGIGAAAGTSLSFLFWSVFTLIISEKLWRVRYYYLIMLFQVSVGIISCYLILILYQQQSSIWGVWLIASLNTTIVFLLSIPRKHFHKFWQIDSLRL